MFIASSLNHPSSAFEFKFDRPIPSQVNSPRTQKAGAVIADLFRLSHVPIENAQQRIFIYLTTSEMANYFMNVQNQLVSLFELSEGHVFEICDKFWKDQTSTFQTELIDVAKPCSVTSLYRRNLSHEFYLRIYYIQD